MKKFILKTFDVILNIVMALSAIYAIFNLVMTFLPVEIQSKVFNWLHMSQEYIVTFSISSIINATILVGSKLLQTHNKLNLTTLINHQQKTLVNNLEVNAQVVDRVNSMINDINAIKTQLNAVLTVNKVNVERNIEASDKLVRKSEKEAYKSALKTIEEAQKTIKELNNITSIYERTDVKEIVVEKEHDSLSGRV